MDHFEKNHPEIPVIRINGDDIDFIKHQHDLETIFEQLKPYLTKQ